MLRSLQLHKWTAAIIAASTVALALVLLLAHQASFVATSAVAVSPNLRAETLAEHESAPTYSAYLDEQIHAITSDSVLTDAVQRLQPGVWRQSKESLEASVARLRQSLTVKRDSQSYHEVVIALSGSNPAHLADTVNAVTYSYLDDLKSREVQARNERLASLRQARELVRKQLVDKLQEQARVTHQPGNAAAPLEGDTATEETGLSQRSLRALRDLLVARRAALLDELAAMSPDDIGRKTAERQLGQTIASLREVRLRLREQPADDIAQPLNSTQERAAAGSGRRQTLSTEIQALRTRYAVLDAEMRLQEKQSAPPASVRLSYAAPTPNAPRPSFTRFILPLLLPVTVLMTLGGVVLLDLVDDRVHSRKDVEQLLGFAPMGVLFNDHDVTAEIFDKSTMRVAASIDQLVRTAGVRIIVLTPVTAGAASIAEHLGTMLARLGRNTLTIDATGKTPPVVYVPFDLTHAPHRELGAQSFVRTSGSGGSTAVLTQPFAPSVTPLTNFIQEAFAQPAMNYDLVLVNAAPILNAPETGQVARFADVTVLIAEAGYTTKAHLLSAARLLERLQTRGMATIVSKIAFSRTDRAMQDVQRAQRNERKSWRERALEYGFG